MKTANEWAASAGLNGLYVDRTLEVLVEAVRAEFREAVAAGLRERRRELFSVGVTNCHLMDEAADLVERFGTEGEK